MYQPATSSNAFKFEDTASYIPYSHTHSSSPPILSPDEVLSKVQEEDDLKRRRQWTKEEDNVLRRAVDIEHPEGGVPYKWLEVSRHIPGRSNKDCRKRWYNKWSCPTASKGSWSREEDAALVRAVEKYGTKWQLVAAVVKTRKGCQCARRWYDTLNPAIDKAPWTSDDDTLLLAMVNEHGKKWSYIAQTYFPGRTGLAAKNRFFALVTSTMRRRRSHQHAEDQPKLKLEPIDGDTTSLFDTRRDFFSNSPSGLGNHHKYFLDTHSGSESDSSSRSHSPSSSMQWYSTAESSASPDSGASASCMIMSRDSELHAKALMDFEYELSCQLKPAVPWIDHSVSGFPVSPVSTCTTYSYDSPLTSPIDSWNPWNAAFSGLYQDARDIRRQ